MDVIRWAAASFGTPMILYDEESILKRVNCFTENFRSEKFETRIVYASKAYSGIYLTQLLSQAGVHMDAVSLGEMGLAMAAGFDPHKLVLHGNNKSRQELLYALERDVGTIVLDHPGEFRLLQELMEGTRYRPRVLLRINPIVHTATHAYVQTANEDSKFGMPLGAEVTEQLIEVLASEERIHFAGFHCHIGSQISEAERFFEAARHMVDYAATCVSRYGMELDELNLGGGFAVPYVKGDPEINWEAFLKKYVAQLEQLFGEYELWPRLVSLEPGRSLVNEFGCTIYEVQGIKRLPSGVNYLFVDGGMADNPRPALYGAKYEAWIPGREAEVPCETYRVAGKCCESGDVLIHSIELPEVQLGDLLCVRGTGAYTYSMASNYNRMEKPAVAFVKKDGSLHLAQRRETLEDLLRLECPYEDGIAE